MAEWLSVLVEKDVNGNLLDEAKCEPCHGNAPALSVPNSIGDRYVSIPYNRNNDLGLLFFHVPSLEVNQYTYDVTT